MTNRCSPPSQPRLSPLFWSVVGLLLLGSTGPILACGAEEQPTGIPELALETAAGQPSEANPDALAPTPYADLTLPERAALEQRLRDRQATLPYQFLAVQRCPSLTNQARLAFSQKDYDQALASLNAAIAQQPDRPEHWLNRAMVYYYLGQDGAARSDATQAYALNRRHTAVDQGYRALVTTLDGKLPDPRRAVEVPTVPGYSID